MADWRDLPPVEPVEEPERFSQTFLTKASLCPRSAYLYLKHGGGTPSHAMHRGTAIHRFRENWIKMLVERGDNVGETEEAKVVLDQVLNEAHDLVLPASEQDGLRIMAFHIAEGTWIDPSEVVAVEDTFDVEIAGRTVSGRIDLATMSGALAVVDDLKSSYAIPDAATFEGKLQLPFYAVAFMRGRVRGEPIGLGAGITQLELRESYPRYFFDAEGTVAYRSTLIDYAAVLDHEQFLERLIRQTEGRFASGKWDAIPGSHCNECPAASECPIPARLRNWQGELAIGDPIEKAQIVATRWWYKHEGRARAEDAGGPSIKADWELLKAWVDANGPLRFGHDLILEYSTTEKEELRRGKNFGKQNFRIAIEEAVERGRPFKWEEWHKQTISTTLRLRTLSPHELLAEQEEGNDGREPESD